MTKLLSLIAITVPPGKDSQRLLGRERMMMVVVFFLVFFEAGSKLVKLTSLVEHSERSLDELV